MTTRFRSLNSLVPFAKLRAQRGLYDGRMSTATQRLIALCRHAWLINPAEVALILFTRDVGHHTSGWWKNPDYERCFHLSVSYRDARTEAPLPHDRDRSEGLARAFFGDDAKLAWIEGPYSPEGRARDVWHYRVFCDEGWQAFKPRGEVYDREWTPADWRSFSDVHGYTPAQDDAPFLLAAST